MKDGSLVNRRLLKLLFTEMGVNTRNLKIAAIHGDWATETSYQPMVLAADVIAI
jgi:hypothetical protein